MNTIQISLIQGIVAAASKVCGQIGQYDTAKLNAAVFAAVGRMTPNDKATIAESLNARLGGKTVTVRHNLGARQFTAPSSDVALRFLAFCVSIDTLGRQHGTGFAASLPDTYTTWLDGFAKAVKP